MRPGDRAPRRDPLIRSVRVRGRRAQPEVTGGAVGTLAPLPRDGGHFLGDDGRDRDRDTAVVGEPAGDGDARLLRGVGAGQCLLLVGVERRLEAEHVRVPVGLDGQRGVLADVLPQADEVLEALPGRHGHGVEQRRLVLDDLFAERGRVAAAVTVARPTRPLAEMSPHVTGRHGSAGTSLARG